MYSGFNQKTVPLLIKPQILTARILTEVSALATRVT